MKEKLQRESEREHINPRGGEKDTSPGVPCRIGYVISGFCSECPSGLGRHDVPFKQALFQKYHLGLGLAPLLLLLLLLLLFPEIIPCFAPPSFQFPPSPPPPPPLNSHVTKSSHHHHIIFLSSSLPYKLIKKKKTTTTERENNENQCVLGRGL